MVNQHYLIFRKVLNIINQYLIEGDNADIIYLGFSKAFDMVFHNNLQVKMKNLSISKNKKTVNIVRSFLIDETMKVKIVNNYSETQNILSNVHWRFVLGPLLFLIFINYLPNDKKPEIKLFAGDVKLLIRPILKETNWFKDIWKLRFNMEKYKVLYIASQNSKDELSNREIKKVNDKFNHGIGFDDRFKADIFCQLYQEQMKWLLDG